MSELATDSFSEVKIADRELLKPLLDAARASSCDYTFPNLYMWGEIYGLRWAVADGLLIVHSAKDDVALMPVGRQFGADELRGVSDLLAGQGKSGNFVLAGAAYVKGHPSLEDLFEARPDPDNADYIYATEALVELKGNKLHRKKNLLSQFLRNNPGHRCERMERGHFAECFTLSKKWCEDRNCETLGFTHETSALKRGFDRFEDLGLEGIVIFSRDRLAAFSVFSGQNDTTADVHFEKYDPEIKGSAQVINWETAKHLRGRFAYINREQDLGLEGLRRAKRSYCPAFMVETYALRRREDKFQIPRPPRLSESNGGQANPKSRKGETQCIRRLILGRSSR